MRNIVVGFDGTVESKGAVRVGANLADKEGSTLYIVYVMSTLAVGFDAASGTVADYVESVRRGMADHLKEIGQEVRRPGLAVETVVLEGASPVRRIAEFAGVKQADLVVVGSHGQSAISRFFLGSVAHGLTHSAPCSVLVAR